LRVFSGKSCFQHSLFIRIQVLVRACGVDRGRGSTTTTALEIMTELPSVEDVHAVFHGLPRFVDGLLAEGFEDGLLELVKWHVMRGV